MASLGASRYLHIRKVRFEYIRTNYLLFECGAMYQGTANSFVRLVDGNSFTLRKLIHKEDNYVKFISTPF